MNQDKRSFLALLGSSTLAVTTTTTLPVEAQLPPLRTVDWVLDSASGLVLDANAGLSPVGAWIGGVLPGDRFPASRLSVLRIVGNAGEDIVLAVETNRPYRGPGVPALVTAFALERSLWQPVNGQALVAPKQGGWVLTMTLVGGRR